MNDDALKSFIKSMVEFDTGGRVVNMALHAPSPDGERVAWVDVVMPTKLEFVPITLNIQKD